MSFIQSMQQRYTTKKYNPSKKIASNKIEELKEILRLSPSSINSQPWQYIFVSDQETRNKLAKVSFHNDSKIEDCDTVIVFSRINNLELFEEKINEYLSEGAVDYYNNKMKSKPVEEIKMWFDRQVYLSVGVLMSACAEMKIDSTAMGGIEPEEYDKILGLKDYKTLVAVAIGHRDEEDKNQPKLKPKSRMPLNEVVKCI